MKLVVDFVIHLLYYRVNCKGKRNTDKPEIPDEVRRDAKNMNIIIKETGKQETLKLIDRKTGVNWINDFIGNNGGIGKEDHQFTYDAEQDVYVCNQDTFDWWEQVVADQQKVQDRMDELSNFHGSDAVTDAVSSALETDLEGQAAAINQALDEAFGEESPGN